MPLTVQKFQFVVGQLKHRHGLAAKPWQRKAAHVTEVRKQREEEETRRGIKPSRSRSQ